MDKSKMDDKYSTNENREGSKKEPTGHDKDISEPLQNTESLASEIQVASDINECKGLDKLLKSSEKPTIPVNVRKHVANVDIIVLKNLLASLSVPTTEYVLESSTEIIKDYLKENTCPSRLSYSDITLSIYNMSDGERGTVLTNCEKLVQCVMDEDETEQGDQASDYQKMVLKLCDHIKLAHYQCGNTQNVYRASVDDVKQGLNQDLKRLEKEYISILGIFAAIILAFVSGITFSTSVLNNIASSSIYRLLLVVDLLAFMLINIIYMLMSFIAKINDKDKNIDFFHIKDVNIILLLIFIVVVLGWFLSIHHLASLLEYKIWK